MSSRPDVSELIMNPLFNQAGGPFDPQLAKERAEQVARLLEAHPNVGTSVPQTLGAGIRRSITPNGA